MRSLEVGRRQCEVTPQSVVLGSQAPLQDKLLKGEEKQEIVKVLPAYHLTMCNHTWTLIWPN